eukprot:scaffold28677_cov112-Isochrysis_galbana.AAC.9
MRAAQPLRNLKRTRAHRGDIRWTTAGQDTTLDDGLGQRVDGSRGEAVLVHAPCASRRGGPIPRRPGSWGRASPPGGLSA